jgi:hypothetical protein
MIKLIIVGAWACLATLASSYATVYFRANAAKGAADQNVAAIETRKSKEIDIPKIRDGALKGYVVTQFVYSVSGPAEKKLSYSPEPFVIDEAFRYIFNDDSIDLANLKKYDLQKFTDTVIKNVNARLKTDVVQDLAVQEFTFLTSAEVKQHL